MAKLTPTTSATLKPRTRLIKAGRDHDHPSGVVDTPIYRGSTVLFDSYQQFKTNDRPFTYATHGTPTTRTLTTAWSELSGAFGTVLTPSGLAAVSVALMAAVGAGDHLLVTDSAYQPTRQLCDRLLRRMGVETTYYDPEIGGAIETLFRPTTRAVLAESPGSQSFEVQDVPAIAAVAHARGACLILDNTWATPLFFPPHERGADIAIEAGTKYLSGHSDLLLGLTSANERYWPRLHATFEALAIGAGPDDAYLGFRGLRTLELRLREAERQGLAMAHWLAGRPEVLKVLHPALPEHPGHAIWQRDFSGSSGVFSIILRPVPETALANMLDGLELFGLGYSWGGYLSLVTPFDCSRYRTATKWAPGGPALRLQIGLEDIEDLQADLDRGFARLRGAE